LRTSTRGRGWKPPPAVFVASAAFVMCRDRPSTRPGPPVKPKVVLVFCVACRFGRGASLRQDLRLSFLRTYAAKLRCASRTPLLPLPSPCTCIDLLHDVRSTKFSSVSKFHLESLNVSFEFNQARDTFVSVSNGLECFDHRVKTLDT